jgi:hypothetical protein
MTSPPLGTGWGGMPSGVCELLFSHRTSIAYTGDVYLDRLHRRCGSGPPAVQADLERVFVLDRVTPVNRVTFQSLRVSWIRPGDLKSHYESRQPLADVRN